MWKRTSFFLIALICGLTLTILSFRMSPEAPRAQDEAMYIPRTEVVQWLSLGHRSTAASLLWINGLVAYGESLLTGNHFRWITHLADASTRLDSLFKTPYSFVAAVTPVGEKDTSDFSVLRRGIEQYPEDWQMALSLALRLAEGPSRNYSQAAAIMERFADDATVLPHVRTLHRSFQLRQQTTEMALMMVIDDNLNPRYTGYRSSLVAKAARALNRDPRNPEDTRPIWDILNKLTDHVMTPDLAFEQLRALKRVP